MKRLISIITIVTSLSGLSAQVASTPNALEIGKQFYQTTEWAQSFAGNYGVNTDVEPGIPEDPVEREVLGQIRTFLQDGTDAGIKQALDAIELAISNNQKTGKNASPMLLQIAGSLAMRMAEIVPASERDRMTKKAETYFRRAIDPETGFPNFLRAHKNLANILFRNDQPEEASKHFVRALQLGDKDSVTYGLLGAIYLEEGKLISAESALRSSLMLNPKVIEFRQLLGNTLLQQERYNEAKELFNELLAEKPNNVNFWVAQSNAFIALEMIDEATRNLEMVRMMGESNIPSLMLLGDVYMNKNMVDEATDAYIEAVNTKGSTSTDLDNFIRSARTLISYASYENAMKVVQAINENTSPNEEQEVELLTISSQINIAMGAGKEAAENLIALLKRDPFNANALITLAEYYAGLRADEGVDEVEATRQVRENQNLAFNYFDRATNLEDIDAQVKAYIGKAMLHIKRDELREAADSLEDAQGLKFQDNVQAYLTQIRAAIQNRRG